MASTRAFASQTIQPGAAHREVINSARTHFAAVLVGTCFIFFYVMMPITLGSAAESRGYSDTQLGFLAASFMTGVALPVDGGTTAV